MADIYPDAPKAEALGHAGSSGSTDNMQALLGIGAYTVGDDQQPGTNFGQNLTESFVKALIPGQVPLLSQNWTDLSTMVTQFTNFLKTFELDMLKMVQPMIPGATDADFADVDTAVAKIMSYFNMGLSLGIDDFNNWVASIFDPNAALWQDAKEWWDTVFAQLASYPPVGSSAATVATWWSTLLVDLGLTPTDAGNIANFISGNYDAAKQAKAWFDQLLASLGLGSGTAVGTLIGGHGTSISSQKSWWDRFTLDIIIFCDFGHQTYPAGSQTDTKTTTVGGKRTWYSAIADFLDLFNVVTTTTAPVVTIKDVGTAQAGTDAAVADLSQKVAALSATSSGGSKLRDDFAVGGPSNNDWGPNFTVTGTGASHLAASILTWDSTTIGHFLNGITSYATPGDVQVIKMVLQTGIQYAGRNTIRGRVQSGYSRYVFARFAYNQVELGYYNGTSETVWDTQPCNPAPGAQLELHCGTATDDWDFSVWVNGAQVAHFNDSSHVSTKGSSQRLSALRLESGNLAGFNSPPGNVTYFEVGDGSATTVTGSGARHYRVSSSGVVMPGAGTMPNPYWDTQDYMSSDISWDGVKYTVSNAGQYSIRYEVQLNGAGTFSGNAYPAVFVNGIQTANGTFASYSGLRILAFNTTVNCQAGDTIEPGAAFASAQTLGKATGFVPEVVLTRVA